MFKFGDRVSLKVYSPNTKLKTRIDRHGNDWEVFSDVKPMMCFNGEQGVLIRSILDGDMRNVKVTDLELLC